MLNPISRHDFGGFFASLEYYLQDKALIGSLKHQYPELVEISRVIMESERREATLRPFPTIDQFTAVQAAVFDNRPDGLPGKGARYALTLEMWTAPAEQIQTHKRENYQFKANLQLYSRKVMTKKVRELRGLSADFIAALAEVVGNMEADALAGIVLTKRPGEGSKYHPVGVLVRNGIQGAETDAILFSGVDILRLPKFSDTKPDGKTKLSGKISANGGKVILQSRCDLSGFSETWATGSWDVEPGEGEE